MGDEPAGQRHSQGVLIVLAVLVLWRIVYHSLYLQDVPFALATFSDGRQYELSAIDLLQHAPLGTKPFYLQGVYAYFLAVPMAIAPWVSLALLAQLLVSGLTLWLFHRTALLELGPRVGPWATVALLAYPMVAFYENKFLTAELTLCACVLMLAAASRLRRQGGLPAAFALGAAVGFGVLARPNLLLVAPFAVWAIVIVSRGRVAKALGAWAVGVLLLLAPMAARNVAVTGQLTVFPAHGGGTSFYIGNNAHAKGVWNPAGGLLSGDVSQERREVRRELHLPRGTAAAEAAAVGRELYARAFEEIAADPGRWLWLEVRKVWLLVGSDELTQDYDVFGEEELVPFNHRVGLPFGALLVLALVGALVWRKRARADAARWRPVGLLMLGIVVATVAANLIYFTSSQHRLPLAVPAAFLVPWGLLWLRGAVERSRYVVVGALVLAVGLTFVPRRRNYDVSAVHYYNLAIAWLTLDESTLARDALDEAVERRPDHPVILIERAKVRRELGQPLLAREDLAHIDTLSGVPRWVRERAVVERLHLDGIRY